MSDLREQLQKHYDAKALPAAKVEALLEQGRAEAGSGDKIVSLPKRRVTFWRMLPAMAAAIVLLSVVAIWWVPGRHRVSYATVDSRIVEIFGKGPTLPKRSQNSEELRAWLLAQGAPADFQIPKKLRGLKSFGCEVVDMHGRPAYLTCFWTEKKPGVDEGSLVHLLVAHRKDFKDAPPTGAPQYNTMADWSFAAWSEGDVIYTMAANAPMEQLKKFIARANNGQTDRLLAAGRSGLGRSGRGAFDLLQLGEQTGFRN
jgi:hypothetical protein